MAGGVASTADTSALVDFVTCLPKCELHLHIEGTLEPELMFKLAARNWVQLPYTSTTEARMARNFENLQAFLDLYAAGCSVLLTEEDFFDLTWEYLTRAHRQGVIHTEVSFDPQNHTERGISFHTVFQGIQRALKKANDHYGITSKVIVCILRHLSVESAMQVIDQALPYKASIAAIGLDSSELGHPPSKFEAVFQRALGEGFLTVAHAGEEGPPAYIRDALDMLQVSRVDHGIRCLEDPHLLHRLRATQIPLTLCPLSNLRLKVYDGVLEHKIRDLLNQGLHVTINSDDPGYFGGYIAENYLWVIKLSNLSLEQVCAFARNSFQASFLEPNLKQRGCQMVDGFLKRHRDATTIAQAKKQPPAVSWS